jgi:spermidine synthase
MVVEILGVRLISPVYGTGIHAWASLISVALVALAAGSFAGGRLADRRPGPRPFFLVVVAAGVLVETVPLYAPAVIPVFEPAGLRAGALLAATATFLPPLFLLGCAGPLALRALARDLSEVGKRAGGLYAVSTLGSVAGTLLTGFLLAPVLAIDDTLRLLGLVLAVTGALGLFSGRAAGRAGAGLLLAGALLFPPEGARAAPPGVPVFSADTPFQRVEVADHAGERWLYLDGCVHTHFAPGPSADPRGSYIRLFAFLPGFRPDARTLLMLGVGGGALDALLAGEEYEVTAVEIDPVVLSVARHLFGTLAGAKRLVVEDARTFVRRADEAFDLVALDVCGSDFMPEHLVTAEFFREARRVLRPGGVLALNSIGSLRGRVFPALAATLSAAFPRVEAFAGNPEGPLTNVVFYASDGELVLPWAFEEDGNRARVRFSGGTVLTDQRNPVNLWNAPDAREIRRTRRERY